LPEARTKFEAEQAEIEAKKAVFEGRYGRPAASMILLNSSVILTLKTMNLRRGHISRGLKKTSGHGDMTSSG